MKKKKSETQENEVLIPNGHILSESISDKSIVNGQNSSSSLENVSSRLQNLQVSEQVEYAVYKNELQMPDIMKLIQKDLSEPYSIYTYRYFIHNWPHLCFMVSFSKIFRLQLIYSPDCVWKGSRNVFKIDLKWT